MAVAREVAGAVPLGQIASSSPATASRRYGCTTFSTPAATYLRHGDADLKEIQEVLGHSNLAITSDTYISVILEFQCSHTDAAADLIPRDPTAATTDTLEVQADPAQVS